VFKIDTEKQRKRRRDDARLAKSGSKQLLMVSTESLTMQQRMAARRALKWIGVLKAQMILDMKYQTCS